MRMLQVYWIFLLSSVLAEEPVPFVFWSMDKTEGTKIIPENNTDSKFQGDFSSLSSDPSAVFVPGFVGDALLVQKDSFDLAESITRRDCIRTPNACTSGGISFTFWLNILKWNSESFQIFFRTTTSTKSTPGVYFGKRDDENLLSYFREDTGKYYETAFPQSYFWNTWSHLAIVWAKDSDQTIYVNGSLISTSSSTGNAGSKYVTLTDFAIGSSLAPDFMLDEFKVFYRNLSALEAMDVYMEDLDKGIIIPSTSTATSKTTTPTTTSTTTTTTTTSTSTTSVTTTTPPTTTFPPTTSRRTDTTYEKTKTTAVCTKTTTPSSGWKPNILLGILIPLLVALVSAILCLLLLCCCKDRKSKKGIDRPVRYTEVRTADSPFSSNPGTDVETDADNERQKPLIRPV